MRKLKVRVWEVLLVFTIVILSVKSYQMNQALTECIDDISNKCAAIFSYTTMLEAENARLNGLIKKCAP